MMHRETNCLHCLVNQAINSYCEKQRLETGSPVDVGDVIATLLGCTAEVVAGFDDNKMRKHVTKEARTYLQSAIRQCRANGTHVNGPNEIPLPADAVMH
jgi:hypothetical protein